MENRQDKKAQQALIKIVLITISSAVMAFNLKSFVDTGGLYPGGFSGITVLLQRIVYSIAGVMIPYSLIYLPLNLIPAYIGFKYIGKKFTLYSLYAVILTSLLTDLIPRIPITYDILLISIFGGIVNGISIVIALVAGASSGGTDFISIYFSEKKGKNAFNYILAGNIVILLLAGVLFGVDKALYSIIFQFTTTQVINLMYKRYEKHTFLIITSQPNVIYGRIKEITNHDATLIKGTGFYQGVERNMVYSVVGADEVDRVMAAIKGADPHAFVNVVKTEQLNGRFYTPPKE
ncbi:MAG: YitT family protein [Clostridia bacterium]|nr:YitT family protein [Clostridia bacterium]